jgi:hypothetical protein
MSGQYFKPGHKLSFPLQVNIHFTLLDYVLSKSIIKRLFYYFCTRIKWDGE